MNVFVGSSKESLEVAKRISGILVSANHTPLLWSEPGLFIAGKTIIENLENVLKMVDAAIFVFGKDDKQWYHGEVSSVVRDNIIFEYGLFIGQLSRNRVCFCCSGELKIATDLQGVYYIDFGNKFTAEEKLMSWINAIHNTSFSRDSQLWGRKYILKETKWKISLNNDLETLKGICESKQHIKCTYGWIEKIEIAFAPLEYFSTLSSNDDYKIKIDCWHYTKGRVGCTPPSRNESKNFSFDIVFDPPLQTDDEVSIHFTYTIPKYKIATKDYIIDYLKKSHFACRDFEHAYFYVDDPIEECVYELNFSPECMISPQTPKASLHGVPFCIDKNSVFIEKNDNGTTIKLSMTDPVLKACYSLPWKLPSLSEIKDK